MRSMLKICGLMRAEDVQMCCDHGVDICGFVTEYPLDVPWNLTAEDCRELLRYVAVPSKSCIVTGGEREKIHDLAMMLRPNYVQLHYHETLEDTAYIVKKLSPHGISVIKTIPNSSEERLAQFGIDSPEDCAKLLSKAGVAVILVDSRGPSNASAGGSAADMSFFRRVKASAECTVMLGGGIRSDNCCEIITQAHPDIIDVMTGVESEPGKKSRRLLTDLLKQVK